MTRKVKPSALNADPTMQARVAMSPDVEREYADSILAGDEFPPVDAIEDADGNLWVYDGFHRLGAANLAGAEWVTVSVTAGTIDDARWLALAANKSQNASRRTNADKRRAVSLALTYWPDVSNGVIAKHVGVDDKTVASARKRLTPELPESTSRKGADGRTIDTANIGKRPAPPIDDPEDEDPPLLEPEFAVGHAEIETPWHDDADLSPWSDEVPAEARTAPAPKPRPTPPEREPGDDTDAIEAERAAEKARPKIGSPLFDWRGYESHLGQVARGPDAIGNAYPGEKSSPEYRACMALLSEFAKAWKGWSKRLQNIREAS